jgi:hypothetical protein
MNARQNRRKTHGNEARTAKTSQNAWQSTNARQQGREAHGKENKHGKGAQPCRAHILCLAL